MTAALDQGAQALFGPVISGWATHSENVVGYLAEYAQFDRPLASDLHERPGINVIAPQELAKDASVLIDGEFVKTRLLARLEAEQMSVQPVEAASVTYHKAYRFGRYCQHRFDHGRCYGAGRVFGFPGGRLLSVVATLVLPLLRTARIFGAARNSDMRAACWRWLHRILVAETAWSAGEAWGYLTGEGDARRRLI